MGKLSPRSLIRQFQILRDRCRAFVYYRVLLENGSELHGRSDENGRFRLFLPESTNYTLYTYSPRTNRFGVEEGRTGVSGNSRSSRILLSQRGGFDLDSDGIPDVGEFVLGTHPSLPDSDSDGVSDQTELAEGLDPLSGVPLVTGVVASLPLQGEAKQVVVVSDINNVEKQTAYVATGSYGLAIVDVSQFNNPTLLGQIDLPGDAVDVAVDPQSGLVAVALGSGGLSIVDVSTATTPSVRSTFPVIARQVEIKDGVAYVAVDGDVQAYALQTGSLLQTLSLSSSNIIAMARDGAVLFVMDTQKVLRAIDISGANMVNKGSLALPLQVGGSLFVGNGVAYIGDGAALSNTAGFAAVDTSNPNSLSLLSGVDAANIQGQSIAVNGSGLAVSVGSVRGPVGQPILSLDVIDVRDPASTDKFVTRYALTSAPSSVVIAGGIAYVANGIGGLSVVNYQPFDNKRIAPTVSVSASNIDVDPTKAGIQVVEGSSVSIRTNINDDIQVRSVELLLDGAVIQTSLTFPFNLTALIPQITANKNTAILAVRATDTGGNSTTSTPVTLELVPDTTPPTFVSIDPPNGSKRGKSLRTIQLGFSESMDPSTLVAANFSLVNTSNQSITPTSVEARNGNSQVLVHFPALELGTYTFTASNAALKDRSGNSLAGTAISSRFELVPFSARFSNPNGGFWDDPNNWDGGRIPGPTDDVLLDSNPNSTVTIRGPLGKEHCCQLKSPHVRWNFGCCNTLNRTRVYSHVRHYPRRNSQTRRCRNRQSQRWRSRFIINSWHSSSCREFPSGHLQRTRVERPNQYRNVKFMGPFNVLRSQQLRGDGDVVFSSDSTFNGLLNGSSGDILSIGPNITIRGRVGWLGQSINIGPDVGVSDGIVINEGVIQADTAGQVIHINAGTFRNEGGKVRVLDNGGIVFRRTIDNAQRTLVVEGQGNVSLFGTIINGGVVSIESGVSFDVTNGSVLNGITVNGDLQVRSNGEIIVRNGLNMNGSLNVGTTTNWGAIIFDGSQTLGGTGNVVFSNDKATGGNSTRNGLLNGNSGDVLTIGPNLTIRGKVGWIGRNINSGGVDGGAVDGVVINQGVIQADTTGEAIYINAGAFRNQGGKVRVLNNGAIGFRNTIDNTERTLVLEGQGQVALNGIINGGTVNVGNGVLFDIINGSVLNGITVDGDLHVKGNGEVKVRNGLNVNGSLHIGTATNWGAIIFDGSQTLGGTGNVVFSNDKATGGNSTRNGLLNGNSGDVLTIGPNLTIRGKVGWIGRNITQVEWMVAQPMALVINQGVIQADTTGEALYINAGIFENRGTVRVINNAGLALQNAVANFGTISSVSGILSLSGPIQAPESSTSHQEIKSLYRLTHLH